MNDAETETNKVAEILESLDVEPINSGARGGEWIAAPSGGDLESINPADGSVIAKVQLAGPREYDQVANQAVAAFESWRMTPAPQRGEIVREIGNELRLHKADLGALVSIEMGKILAEGLGEVQEMIDMADFSVGLSRQLYGLTKHSERPAHRMYDQWHPVVVARRLGRTILELGGNNAIIVMNDANLDLALRAVVFGAVGTAGQRCTTTRRLFLQRGIAERMTSALVAAYKQVKIGSPLDEATLMGPLVSRNAVADMLRGLEIIQQQGGEVLYGGKHLGGCYVEPALVRARPDMPIVREEIFAPILYLIEFDKIKDAIDQHNAVPQGLSSAMFTTNLISAETFLSARGSDCGIANINIGTSGAEIGGAFGGEKETGGGREAGSDSWKAYMRRQTTTINWSSELPLAQGIKFHF